MIKVPSILQRFSNGVTVYTLNSAIRLFSFDNVTVDECACDSSRWSGWSRWYRSGKGEGGRCFHPTPAWQSTFGSRSHLTCTPCTPKLFYHYQHLYRYNFQYWHAIMYLDSASSPIGCHFARWRFSVQKIFSKIGNMAGAEIKHKSTIRNCMQTTWIDVLSLHMIRIEKTNETKKRSSLHTISGPYLSSLSPISRSSSIYSYFKPPWLPIEIM